MKILRSTLVVLLVSALGITVSIQSYAAGLPTKVSFDVQSVLPSQWLNPGYTLVMMPNILLNDGTGYSGTTSQFKVPNSGVYQFNANVSIDTGGQDCSAFILSLFLNGNEFRRLSRTQGGPNTHQFELTGSILVRLALNDVVDIRIFNNCTNGVFVEADGRAYFSGVRLY
jgi:hypothetical protein